MAAVRAAQLAPLVLLLVCARPLRAQGSEYVTGFQFGLMCDIGQETPKVCVPTDTIRVTGESRCTYNHERRPCTWYGYSFDYELLTETPTLTCAWSATLPVSEGNPERERSANTRSGTYEIPLPGRRGHFVNPQYTLRSDGPATSLTFSQTCSYEGTVAFTVSYTVLNGEPGQP